MKQRYFLFKRKLYLLLFAFLLSFSFNNLSAQNPTTIDQEIKTTKAFPNPAKDVLNVEIEILTAQNATIRIFNVIGKELKKKEIEANSGINTFTIDVSTLPKGTYIYKVEVGKAVKLSRFIKR